MAAAAAAAGGTPADAMAVSGAADSDLEPFFSVVDPLAIDTFLSATREVLETSLMLFAPLGLPPLLKRVCPSEAGFLDTYGPRFRAILEAVSEAVYEARGISESQVRSSQYLCCVQYASCYHAKCVEGYEDCALQPPPRQTYATNY